MDSCPNCGFAGAGGEACATDCSAAQGGPAPFPIPQGNIPRGMPAHTPPVRNTGRLEDTQGFFGVKRTALSPEGWTDARPKPDTRITPKPRAALKGDEPQLMLKQPMPKPGQAFVAPKITVSEPVRTTPAPAMRPERRTPEPEETEDTRSRLKRPSFGARANNEPAYSQPGPLPVFRGAAQDEETNAQADADLYLYGEEETFAPAKRERKMPFAALSLIFGILGFFVVPVVASVLAIIFGNVAEKNNAGGRMSHAGKACGIVSLLLWVAIAVIYFLCFTGRIPNFLNLNL